MEGTPDDVLTVEIRLGELFIGEERTFGEHVANRAAKMLLDSDRDLRSTFASRARSISDEEIREAIRPVLADALEQVVTQTNRFGEAVGQPRTLREFVVEVAKRELTVKTTDRRSTLDRRSETLVEWLVREEVTAAFRKELLETVKAAKVEILDALKEQAAEVLAETIQRAARA